MMDGFSKNIRKFSRKFFFLVVIFAIFCGISGAGVKYMFSDTAIRTGDYLFIKVISLQNKNGNIDSNFDYAGFWRSSANIDKFRKSRSQQIDWIRNYIMVSSFRGNVYEIGFKFDGNITPDTVYMNSHLGILCDQLVKQSEKALKEAMTEVSFQTISTSDIYPSVVPVDRRKAAIKYGILGFVVGIIAAEIMVALTVLRRKNSA